MLSHLQSFFLLILVIGTAQTQDVTESPSEICKTCDCSGNKPKAIDCSDRKLESVPEASTWPQEADVEIEANLSHNDIVHVTQIGSIPGLTRLSLNHCKVTLIDDMAFQQLPNLTFIDLSNNQLTSSALTPHVFKGHYAPDGYQPMKAMRVLHLGFNSLHSLDQDLFEHLTFLTELSLKDNPLGVLDHSTIVAISSLDFLKVLDLSYTGLTTLPEHSLHSPRLLVELNLAGNLFKEVPTAALTDTHDLKMLTLDENPISFLDNTTFPALSSLEHLSLSFCSNLTRVGEGSFAGMRSLKELVMTENSKLDFIHPDAFKGQYSEGDDWTLTRLHLNGNKLGVLPRDLLARWNALEELNLTNNPWVCDCESQWMLDELMHLLDSMASSALVCHEPIEMRGKTMQELAQHESHMRCLDMYGNRPERDGAILIGMLIGVLLAVPLTVAVVALWRRFGPQLLGRHPAGPADYSRAFYKRAESSTINYDP